MIPGHAILVTLTAQLVASDLKTVCLVLIQLVLYVTIKKYVMSVYRMLQLTLSLDYANARRNSLLKFKVLNAFHVTQVAQSVVALLSLTVLNVLMDYIAK